MAYAESDLRRAGLDEAGLSSLDGDHADLPEAERAALESPSGPERPRRELLMSGWIPETPYMISDHVHGRRVYLFVEPV